MGVAVIWSNGLDPANRLLVEALETKGHVPLLITTGPNSSDNIGVEIDTSGIRALEISGYPIEDIDVVFFRKPVPLSFADDSDDTRFLNRELMQGIESALSLSEALWINRPGKNRMAADKLGNLLLATKLGLEIPRTWSGTRILDAVKNKGHHRLIGKAMTHGLIRRNQGSSMIFTNYLPEDFDPSEDIVNPVPMLVQEEIVAEADVRATIVGRTVFTAERRREATTLDWREEDWDDDDRWKPSSIPSGLEDALKKLVSLRGLTFGACDLLRHGNSYTFLELNPNGQWAWLELDVGLPISLKLAEMVD